MNSAHILAAVVPSRQFSSVGMEVLSSVIHLFGVSILSYMLSLKLKPSDITSLSFTQFSWPRFLVILNLLDSWAFLFTTGILVHGTGMELSGTVCLLGILNCIIFYASSKVIIYLFLAEKVLVVWNAHRRRFRSKVYVGCLGVIVVYLGVIVFLIWGRIAHFRDDGACVIGLTRAASLTLLIYDLCINVLLTSLFVWPLLKRDFTTALKGVAIRTLWAAGVALTTSCINILVLTIMHGQQLAWVCLASCGTDVVVNAVVLCWVTAGKHDAPSEHSRDPSSHGGGGGGGGTDPTKAFSTNTVALFYSSTASADYSHAAVSGPAPGPGAERQPPLAALRSRFPNVNVFTRGRSSSTSKPRSMHPLPHTLSHADVELDLVRAGQSDMHSVDSHTATDRESKHPTDVDAEDFIMTVPVAVAMPMPMLVPVPPISPISPVSPVLSPTSAHHASAPLLRAGSGSSSTFVRSNTSGSASESLSVHSTNAGAGPPAMSSSPSLSARFQFPHSHSHSHLQPQPQHQAQGQGPARGMQIVITRETDVVTDFVDPVRLSPPASDEKV